MTACNAQAEAFCSFLRQQNLLKHEVATALALEAQGGPWTPEVLPQLLAASYSMQQQQQPVMKYCILVALWPPYFSSGPVAAFFFQWLCGLHLVHRTIIF